MIEIPEAILTSINKISLRREQLQEAIITREQKKQPKIFQVVILSGSPEKSNNPNRGTAHGNSPINNSQEPSYFFSRVKKMLDGIPDPFLEKDRNLAEQLVNMHPVGFVKKSIGRAPQEGEVWSARYQGGGSHAIILMDRVDVDKGFLTLATKDSMYSSSALNWQGETLSDFTTNPEGET